MPLKDIVDISISTESVKVLQAGFGVPLILACSPAWAERTREYTDTAGMVADGFLTTDPAYLMASKVFSQDPRPEKVMVGRLGLKPTQRFKITVKTVENLKKYQVRVGANLAEFTSDANATNDEIVTGLNAAINALGGDTITSTIGGAGPNTYLVLTGNAAGSWDAIESVDINYLEVLQDHADPGVATDLAAIALERATFYAVLNPWNSMAMVVAIAGWAEANKKVFPYQTQDTATISTAKAGTDDVAEAIQAAGYARSFGIYSGNTGDFADAAWAGRCLPFDPGSETWAYKTLAGVTARALTATQIANAVAKSLNYYETIGGVNVTLNGVVGAGEFVDVIRFRDWLEARISEDVYGLLASSKKVGYTDKGIGQIQARVLARLQEGVDVGGLSDNPAPKVTVPSAASVSGADRAARILRNVKFDGVLAGAIHKLKINGTITV